MKRTVYDRQFKIAAVKMATANNVSVKEVSLSLSIIVRSLRRRINEYDEYGESAFPGQGTHFLTAIMKLRSCKKRMQHCGRRTRY